MFNKFAFIALVALSAPAFAQDTTSTATSGSQSSSGAMASQGNQQQTDVTFSSPGTVEYSGRYTVRNVPGIALGSYSGSFSSDYCGGTVQGGVAIAGFGVSGGKPVMDTVCQDIRIADKAMAIQRAFMQDVQVLYVQASAVRAQHQDGSAARMELTAAKKALLADQIACAAIDLLAKSTPNAKQAFAGVQCLLR